MTQPVLTPPPAGWEDLDRLFARPIDDGVLSGAVAVAWQGGAVRHRIVLGRQDVGLGTPMRADTLFRLYSMTKPVTAVAMMASWDDGLWRPEDPVARYLPELSDLRLPGGERPPVQPTMEQLMTHQAGFAYGHSDDAGDQAMRAADVPAYPHDIDSGTFLARLASLPLAYEPGTAWRYSVAMDLQGIIVERATGMPLRDFMRQRLFDPLGMDDTDFVVPSGKLDRVATLYTLQDGVMVPMPESPYVPDPQVVPIMSSGGAGLYSTAGDYLIFGRMLHGGGALDGVRILSEAAVAHMRRSHTPPALLEGGFGVAPHWLRPGYEYAYNGVVVTDPEAAGVALGRGSYFWDGAAGCWFWSDPENDVVLVCMVQLAIDADVLGLQFKSREIVARIVRETTAGA